MAFCPGCCRGQYCVGAQMPNCSFSPKCRHIGSYLPPAIQGQSGTGLEQDDALWISTATSCTGSKETLSSAAGLCRDILTSYHHDCLSFMHPQLSHIPQGLLQMSCHPWTVLYAGSSPSLDQDFSNTYSCHELPVQITLILLLFLGT